MVAAVLEINEDHRMIWHNISVLC